MIHIVAHIDLALLSYTFYAQLHGWVALSAHAYWPLPCCFVPTRRPYSFYFIYLYLVFQV